jgi:hypothetical protein
VDQATEILGGIGQKQMIPVQRNLECHQGTGHTESLYHSRHQMDPAPYKRQIGAAGAHTPGLNDFGHLELQQLFEPLYKSYKRI